MAIMYIPGMWIWHKILTFLADSCYPLTGIGGDIVMRLFMYGWVSECLCPCVRLFIMLCLVGTIQTTVFVGSLSNFTCKIVIMREGTSMISDHRVQGQGQIWQSVY